MDKSYQKFNSLAANGWDTMEVSRALCRSPWGTISSILQSSNQFIKVELGEGTALDFGMTSG